MTLEGAINLNETNDYIVYTMNSVTTGQYGVVVPKNISGTLNMLVDLHMKGSFDGVGNGSKTKEQLVEEITVEYNNLKTKYANGILVMPMIDEVVFENTVSTGDKQKMFDEVKKIGAITSELYKKLTEQGVDKQKIDQKIIIVEKNQYDEKFVVWLKEQMPNFVDGVNYSELSVVQEVVNPFVNNNSIFGPAQDVVQTPKVEEATINTPVNVGGIFDSAPVAQAEPIVAPAEQVAPVEVLNTNVEAVPVINDIFGAAPQAPTVEQAPVASVPTPQPVEAVAPVSVASQPVEAAQSVVSGAPVVNNQVQQPVEGPKPVESAMLEGTIAFTPIPNHPNNPVEPVAEEVVEGTKKSKGFVNLIILAVVLVGVTIVSIELGKYLYSVYGA